MSFEFLLNHMWCLCLWCNVSWWTGPSHHVLKRQDETRPFVSSTSLWAVWHVIFMLIKPKTSIKFSGKFHVERIWWFPMKYNSLHYLHNVVRSLFTYLIVFFYLYQEERLKGEKPEFYYFSYLICNWTASFLYRSSIQICNNFPPTPLSGMRSGTSLVCVEWNNLNLMSPKNFPWHFSVWKQLTSNNLECLKHLYLLFKFQGYVLKPDWESSLEYILK